MAVPNAECKSFATWRGVSAHRSRQRVVEASRPSFVSKHNIYVPAELREVLQPKAPEPEPKPEPQAAPYTGSSSFSADNVQVAIAAVQSSDKSVWRDATTAIRKALSKASNPPIQVVVASGVLPRLVELAGARGQDDPALQLEAAWSLCNVASGTSDECAAVVAAGAVPAVLPHLQSPRADLREQAAWLLGNIAGDGLAMRDKCLAEGLLPPLLAALRDETQAKPQQQLAWCMSNVLRWKPRPDKVVRDALPVLLAMAARADPHEDTLTDAALGRAAEITDRPKAPKSIVSAAVKLLASLPSGGELATAAVIDTGVLAAGFKRILRDSEVEPHISEVLFALSNIVATKALSYQAKAVADAGLIPLVVDGIRQQVKARPRREAAHTLANLTMFPPYARMLWEAGAVDALVDFLTQPQLMSLEKGSISKADSTAAEAAMEGLIGLAQEGKALASSSSSSTGVCEGVGEGEGGGAVSQNPVLEVFARVRAYERLQEAREAGQLPRSAFRKLEKLLLEFPPPPSS
ncbi:hypothetical protein HYH02_003194 [Chlamydomonas schloesseri]|uniref:Importin subunit alpha n=1 Tax=Chlamydomonas schloesseri TaxID=2026947 RepID=A0A835WRI8_9CHLO|nr:hypothetical protein HYH02_003194 [Chlamydomonas schloesseri]|eukprot:KAG2452162.1 hypothetical protein HYH02_003194 [Chlamydomonas schloesseri]